MTESTVSTERLERRRAPRVAALYHIVISSDGESEEVSITVGRTVDVSETGVRVEVPGVLCVDDKVRIEIAVEETVVNARGRVIRVARLGELVEAGIEFTRISDTDRLALLSAP
jgi:c-di-GMP-binding flagellar brake protein YcgR